MEGMSCLAEQSTTAETPAYAATDAVPALQSMLSLRAEHSGAATLLRIARAERRSNLICESPPAVVIMLH